MAVPRLFDITVFGDEPYGNYNRILLSNVLAGSQTVDDEDEHLPQRAGLVSPRTTSTCGQACGWCASTASPGWCMPTTGPSLDTTT